MNSSPPPPPPLPPLPPLCPLASCLSVKIFDIFVYCELFNNKGIILTLLKSFNSLLKVRFNFWHKFCHFFSILTSPSVLVSLWHPLRVFILAYSQP
jgi:hypothetical protein